MRKTRTNERVINSKLNKNKINNKNINYLKSFISGLLLTSLLLGANPCKAQEKIGHEDYNIPKTEKVENREKEKLSGSFMIDPTYSINNNILTTRFQGGGKLSSLDIGGFVDFNSTNFKDGISTAFGKLTLSHKIGENGTSGALEYTLNSENKDQVRIGVKQVLKNDNGSIVFKVYPLDNNGFKPFLLVGASHKINKNFAISGFVGTDIKDEVYYGELELSVGSGKVQGLIQSRTGGDYHTKPKTSFNVGVRAKI